MDLAPSHRLALSLPGPWPGVASALLSRGAPWLQDGQSGEGLLGLPGGPALTTRWIGGAWVSTQGGRTLAGSPWEALGEAQARHGGPWLGAASFELACDEAGHPRQPVAPGTLGQHWIPLREALHYKDGRAELWSWGPTPPDPTPWAAALTAPAEEGSAHPPILSPAWQAGQHREAVLQIRNRILEGGFYVANLCVPFAGVYAASPKDLAQAAFRRACPPFGALLDLGDLHLVCLSMERLLARRGDHLWSEPIKGSAPFTGRPEVDIPAAAALAADPKERAEHTMIVDLVRNDLGRIAQAGSVRVSRSMAVTPFPTVLHMISTVEATARLGVGLAELLRSVLPGGSVTGAPKHAVCAHLAKTEAGPRGFYCGALGWIGPQGDLDLALPIRTAQLSGESLSYWSGGGITRRSDPAREWAELVLKTRALTG